MEISYLDLKVKYNQLREEKVELKRLLSQRDRWLKSKDKEIYLRDERIEKEIRKRDWLRLEVQFQFDKCIESITKIQEKQLLEIDENYKKIEAKLTILKKELADLKLENPEIKQLIERFRKEL